MSNIMNHETYYPKTLARFCPKADTSLSLKFLAIDACLKNLSTCEVFVGSTRNARKKKNLRKYLDEEVPLPLQLELIEKAVDKWYGSERILKLMDLFEPKRIIREDVDLIGSFRYAYGCYYSGQKLFWSNGTIERLNLNAEQCNRLYQYICWSDAIKKKLLRTITLSTERGALHNSILPNLFARSSNLTSVTILNGATNHILRILGLNCHHLKLLDISHSQAVTDVGLKNLLLCTRNKRRNNLAEEDNAETTNPCCQTICKIILVGTEISLKGLDFACQRMMTGYYIAFLPDTMIIRPFDGVHLCKSVPFRTSHSVYELMDSDDGARALNQIMQRFVDRRKGTEDVLQCLDIFPSPKVKGRCQVYLRPVDSHLCEAMIGTCIWKNVTHITHLILAWDSFTWSVTNLPDLTELGFALPSLCYLKARVQGVWEREHRLFPHLRECYIWTVCDATVLSFINSCPKIQTMKFNCLDLIRSEERLDDRNLMEAFKGNHQLLRGLKEVCIRPAPHLTKRCAGFLLKYGKKLKRLGDMESWSVTTEDIKELNEGLEQVNSKCVLTVLSFPPKKKHEYLI